ncbi:hypothetical protein MARTH_orf531 [Metamycoplasma arthritidis 158L3-1]|uniref:Uncharacterized protein n=1 Tax=Metamycoplasma arthritidis (strain 158L3-1) TaxID=243272 RepID=B3PMU6_META1|nr:hypothetical protein MARTH_orf531 [Metamycoplasma arthritidis 158L3-1]
MKIKTRIYLLEIISYFCEFFTYKSNYLSWIASMPGSLLPCTNSIEAPPPVEMKLNLSWYPSLLMAVTESPPPTTE